MNQPIEAESPTQPVAKVDLAKYRTGPLVEQLTNLISVPSAFYRIISTMITLAVVMLIGCMLLIPSDELSVVVQTGVYGYSMGAGLVLGIVFGAVRVVAIAMRSIEEILNIILRITGQASVDYEKLQTGQSRMPSGSELVTQVYTEVVIPTVEKAVGAAFGFLGTPLLWFYRRTLGSAVNLFLRTMGDRKLSPEVEQSVEQTAAAGIGGVAKYSQRINAFTTSAEKVVSRIGFRIRFFALCPLYVVFAAFTVIGLCPLLLVWYFTAT